MSEKAEVESNFVDAVRYMLDGLHRVERGECEIHENLWVIGDWRVLAVRGHLEAIEKSAAQA